MADGLACQHGRRVRAGRLVIPHARMVNASQAPLPEPGVAGLPAYAAAKEAIDRGLEVDLDTGLEIERQQFAALFATQDRSTGMDSFVQNGPGKAEFEGR